MGGYVRALNPFASPGKRLGKRLREGGDREDGAEVVIAEPLHARERVFC